jgi:hypothetical protein
MTAALTVFEAGGELTKARRNSSDRAPTELRIAARIHG